MGDAANLRPDSDGVDGCGFWTEGQPGTGALHQRLQPGTAERYFVRVYYGIPSGEPYRKHTFAGCEGDGHYECRRCIFFRPKDPDEGARYRFRPPLVLADGFTIPHPRCP